MLREVILGLPEIVDSALAHHRAGRLDDADRLYVEALEQLPGHADLLFNHGTLLLLLDRAEEALHRFDTVLALRADDAAAWNGRGAALGRLGRAETALDSFDRALAIRPHDGGTQLNRGRILLELNRAEQALASFDRAVAALPRDGAAWHDRGTALRAVGRREDALASFDRAVSCAPDHAPAHLGRGLALLDLQRHDEALVAFDRALALAPGLPEALNNRGLVLQYLGRSGEAGQAYREAIGRDPTMAMAYLNYAGAVTFTPSDPILPLLEQARRDDRQTISGQVQLDLALAKAHGDLGHLRESFAHMARGNRLQRAQLAYDEPSELAHFDRIADAFSRERIEALRAMAAAGPAPDLIFVVGMPRSGTTLIEQILASHPQVRGAGETTAFHDAVRAIEESRGFAPYPASTARIDAAALDDIARHYLTLMRPLRGSGTHLVDKMPSNFFNLGLIVAALPGARIIHCARDPFDTCFSRYAKLFLDRNPYAYDLAELGRYHRRYEGLMAHWRDVLPPGAMLEVRYEDVVGDLAGQVRRLLEFCGLPWDGACLRFFDSARAVKTPSALQVRRPLYASAVGRARPYEAWLGPLKDALGIGQAHG